MRIYTLLFLIWFLFNCESDKKQNEKNTNITYLPYFNTPDLTPEWKVKNHKIPSFSFKNQNGKNITNEDYNGKIQIADFFFTTCPGICPKLTKNMYNIQEHYKSESNIRLISFSVMPWVDNVEQLKNYSIANKVDSSK